METIRIVVADDHPVVRQGLRAALRVLPGLDLAGGAPDGREAVALVSSVQPDIALMDLVMPVMNGVAATATGACIERAAARAPARGIDFHLEPATKRSSATSWTRPGRHRWSS